MKRRTFSREIGMRLYSFFFFLFFLPFLLSFFCFFSFVFGAVWRFTVTEFSSTEFFFVERMVCPEGRNRVLPSFTEFCFLELFFWVFLQSSDFPEVPMKLFTEFHCFFSVRLGKRRFLRGFPRGFPRGFSRVPQVPLGL